MKAIKIDSRKKNHRFSMIFDDFRAIFKSGCSNLMRFDGFWWLLGGILAIFAVLKPLYLGRFWEFGGQTAWKMPELSTRNNPNRIGGRSESFLNFYLKKTGFFTVLGWFFDDFWWFFGEFLKWHMGTIGRKSDFSGKKTRFRAISQKNINFYRPKLAYN